MSALKVPILSLGQLRRHANHTTAPPLPNPRLNALDGPFASTSLKQTMGSPFSRPQKPVPPRLNAASTCT